MSGGDEISRIMEMNTFMQSIRKFNQIMNDIKEIAL